MDKSGYVFLLARLAAILLLVRCEVCPSQTLQTNLSSGPIRVALMNLTCEDNSHRGKLAAINFTAATQAGLQSDARYQWVERAELDKAATELKLSSFGRIDRAQAIRSGRWSRADWSIFGSISTNMDHGRVISLEVVDLQRADVLAETNLTLAPQSTAAFAVAMADVAAVVKIIPTLLQRADQAFQANRQSTTVALLFLSASGADPSLDNLDDDFQRETQAVVSNRTSVHFLRFQRAGESQDEADMVLSGLAESDPDAWEKVADQYIWGTYVITRPSLFEPPNGKRNVAIKLNIWDGKTEPHVLLLSVTNQESSKEIARQMTTAAAPFLTRSQGVTLVDGVRQRVSASIVDSALATIKAGSIESIEPAFGRRLWLSVVKELEIACFFNPGDALARELWARVRWSRSPQGAIVNEFNFDMQRSAAWGAYVDKFGFKSVVTSNPNGWWKPESVESAYLLSAWNPAEMFDYADGNQRQWGMAMDIGGADFTAWKNEIVTEFATRLAKVPIDADMQPLAGEYLSHALGSKDAALRQQLIEKLWPAIIETSRIKHYAAFGYQDIAKLRDHFVEMKQPGAEDQWLAKLTAAANSQKPPAPPVVNSAPVHLPRLTEVESIPNGELFSVPQLTFPPPMIKLPYHAISCPPEIQVKAVRSVTFHDGALWMVVQTTEAVAAKPLTERIEKEMQPVMLDHMRLLKLDTHKQTIEYVPGPLSTNEIASILFRGDTLWAALGDAGVAAWNPRTGELTRYQAAAGITAMDQTALVNTPQGIASIGGSTEFTRLDDGTDMWKSFTPGLPKQSFILSGGLRSIAAQKDKLLLYNSQLLECDFQSNLWTRIADRTEADRIGRPNSMIGDNHGCFWLAANSGLHVIDSKTGTIRNQWAQIIPNIQNGPPPGLIVDPNYNIYHKSSAQLATSIRQEMEKRNEILEDCKTNSSRANLFVPGSRISGPVIALASEGESLWVLLRDSMLLYNLENRSFAGGFSFMGVGSPSVLAIGDHQIWVAGLSGPGLAVWAIDPAPLESTPRDAWVSDEVSPSEIAAHLADFTSTQRAVYEFFAGNDAETIQQLQSKNDEDLDAQSTFLLMTAHAELGHAEQAQKFQAMLQTRFSDSPFQRYSSIGKRLAEIRAKVQTRRLESTKTGANSPPVPRGTQPIVENIMQTYDADGSGTLDEVELTVLFELEPQLLQSSSMNPAVSPAEKASSVLRSSDMNRDGMLQVNELSMALRRAGFFAGSMMHPPPRTNIPPPVRSQTTNQ